MGKSGHKSVARIDQNNNHTHGWFVRVDFNHQCRARFFSDKKYGSAGKALEMEAGK